MYLTSMMIGRYRTHWSLAQLLIVTTAIFQAAGCQSSNSDYEVVIKQRPTAEYGDWETTSYQLKGLYWIISESTGTSLTANSQKKAKLSVHNKLFSITTPHANLCLRHSCSSGKCKFVSNWSFIWVTPDNSTDESKMRLQLSSNRKHLIPTSEMDNAEALEALNKYSSLVIEPTARCLDGPILRFKIKGNHHLELRAKDATNEDHDDIFTEPFDPKPWEFERIDRSSNENPLSNFSKGSIILSRTLPLNPLSKLKVAKDYQRMSRFYREQNWIKMVETILAQDIATAENYHLLGLGAFKLGYSEAAEVYLRTAVSSTQGLHPRMCAPGYCYNLRLPADSFVLLQGLTSGSH